MENSTIAPTDSTSGRARRLAARLGGVVAQRLSPERTRRATFFDRLTVPAPVVDQAINCGRPVAGALAVAIIVPSLLFVAARSAIGLRPLAPPT